MIPIGSNTPKYQAGQPCRYHDDDQGMSFGAIFMGVHGQNAYVIPDNGKYTKIPISWLS